MFCPPGEAGWAAWSVDFGHNFYYPFTSTFAIIIFVYEYFPYFCHDIILLSKLEVRNICNSDYAPNMFSWVFHKKMLENMFSPNMSPSLRTRPPPIPPIF